MKDGGSAFPIGDMHGEGGMSLRDYFAAHCPGDICDTEAQSYAEKFIGRPFPRDGTTDEQALWNVQVEAKMRYLYADAMLAEREK